MIPRGGDLIATEANGDEQCYHTKSLRCTALMCANPRPCINSTNVITTPCVGKRYSLMPWERRNHID